MKQGLLTLLLCPYEGWDTYLLIGLKTSDLANSLYSADGTKLHSTRTLKLVSYFQVYGVAYCINITAGNDVAHYLFAPRYLKANTS